MQEAHRSLPASCNNRNYHHKHQQQEQERQLHQKQAYTKSHCINKVLTTMQAALEQEQEIGQLNDIVQQLRDENDRLKKDQEVLQ